MRNRFLTAVVMTALGALGSAGTAAAHPILMPTVKREAQLQQSARAQESARDITPPAPPCPENGVLYPPPSQWPAGEPYPFGNCGITELPATSMPWGGNMSYWGGNVQVHPKEYLIYWGWGEPGAFPQQTCTSENISEGSISATLNCDPDGAGRYMANFAQQMGGTSWANVSSQFYETDSKGNNTNISNDKNVLAGIWVDDTNDIAPLAKTNSSNPAGPTNTFYDLAEEALRASAHFGVTGTALADANFVVIQPPAYSDPNALNSGYCAFHDFTDPNAPGNSYYAGLKMPDGSTPPYIAYTNIPYQLAINSGGVNVCGENAVNTDAAGKLDGSSIVLGHEIEETITDPGGEYLDPKSNVEYGGWYDTLDADENGDKCAWVGENELTAQGPPEPIPGALGNIQGNAGTRFAVQSLWSNAENQGTGYCAGAGTDSPVPAASYGVSSTSDTPAATARPSISGTPAIGQTLTASGGSWNGSPTSYVYQWERCDSSGQNCIAIDGATSATYTPTAGDVGHTLAVLEYAANPAGSSPTVQSTATSPVSATAPSSTSSSSGAPAPAPTGPLSGPGSTPRRAPHAGTPAHHRTTKPKAAHRRKAKKTKRHRTKRRSKRR